MNLQGIPKKSAALVLAALIIGALGLIEFSKKQDALPVVVTPSKNTPLTAIKSNGDSDNTNITVLDDWRPKGMAYPPSVKTAPAVAISQTELAEAKARNQVMTAELAKLTEELDHNLDNLDKRKELEKKYAAMTKEHNEIAIKIVKAQRQEATKVDPL